MGVEVVVHCEAKRFTDDTVKWGRFGGDKRNRRLELAKCVTFCVPKSNVRSFMCVHMPQTTSACVRANVY